MEEYRYNPLVKLFTPEIKEIIEKKDWHILKDFISTWEPTDIIDLFNELSLEDTLILFRLLPSKLQSDVFSELDISRQELILKNLADQHIKSVISEMSPDDRTGLFEELPPELTRKLLSLLTPEDRREALELLAYPEGSVGRLLTPDYIAVQASWTIEEAFDYIRTHGKDAETINIIYVVDDEWHLLDDIPIRRLILANPKDYIESIMDRNVISINAFADQEEAVRLMQRYNLISLPVVDKDQKLLGIVTVDDILDILQKEQTEDFTKFSAIEAPPLELELITKIKEMPIKRLYRSRVGWLLILLFMDIAVGGIIQFFESTIAKYIVLVTFLPILVDTAGNAGSQSATLVIRALAVGTVQPRDWLYLVGKELAIAGALGVTMGFGISFMGILRGGTLLIGSVVVLSMIINVIMGCLLGVLLPFFLSRLGKDPATASVPLITTLADILGTALYLGIAYLILLR